jgi:hypothetical protein
LQAQSNWSKLEYYFNVGSLPPPYHYSYTITINSDGIGELVYTGGYESTEKNTDKYSFKLSNKKLKKLKKAVKESDILNLDIKTRPSEEIPDGGSSESLQIFGFNKGNDGSESILLKSIPTYPELKYETILEKLYKVIQNSVPEDIWKEANSRKEN